MRHSAAVFVQTVAEAPHNKVVQSPQSFWPTERGSIERLLSPSLFLSVIERSSLAVRILRYDDGPTINQSHGWGGDCQVRFIKNVLLILASKSERVLIKL